MKRLKSYYNRLNLLAFGIFIFLVLMQSLWLRNAANLQQKEQELQLKQIIPDLAIEVNQIGLQYFHEDSLHNISKDKLKEIETAIQTYLDTNGIEKATYFSIFKEDNTDVFFSNQNDSKNELIQSSVKSCLSCILSFSVLKGDGSKRRDGETDEAYYERISEASTFQYYAPVKNLVKEDLIWLTLYQPYAFSSALRSMIGLFIINILLLAVLLYLFNHLQLLLSNYRKLSQLKEDFFNNMTHEFKTPLSSIRLASRVLRQNPNAEKAMTYHNLIERESQTLELQIDKLLELSLLDNKEIALEKEETNIQLLIQEIPKRLNPLLEKHQGEIIFDFQTQQNILKIDQHHISNSLCNLVENSLKYGTPPTQVFITIFQKKDSLFIKIKDNGKGIPEEFQPYIFERFFRGQKNNQYKAKGFGIGLSYVKFVIEAHKGTIQLNQQNKIGTEFIIKLPL